MKKVFLLAAAAFMVTGIAMADGGKKKKCAKGKKCCSAKAKSCCKKKATTAQM